MYEKENDVLTRKQAAKILQCCLTTLDRLDLPRIKVRRGVRFRRADLEAWLAKQAQEQGAAV
jgi:excisionase family DNA binding protein